MKKNRKWILAGVLALLCYSLCIGQRAVNYDETKVPSFILPNPLVTFEGATIASIRQWENVRKPELLRFFTEQVYGKVPGHLEMHTYKILEQGESRIYKNTLRQQVKISIKNQSGELSFTLLLLLPKNSRRAPVFLGCNFYGNHAAVSDPEVIISRAWAKNNEAYHISGNVLTAASRGVRSERWAVQQIIDAGFGLATFYYGEIDPDKNDFSDGIHSLFYKNGQHRPLANEWGSIAAWAWGLSRAMDYLQKAKAVDASKVIVFGHSRLGKTALWAAVNDTRFAAVIANNSGCGGAALSKRCFGETWGVMNKSFPHWLCENAKKFNNNEVKLPVDQHELISLMAPRPVYVASAKDDRWADPKGEYLGAYFAGPVYKLFGAAVLPDSTMPAVHRPVHHTIAYHVREGGHNVTGYDWEQYIQWAKEVVCSD
ncbi:hypothetical protein ABDK00_009255 [Niabella insulamsoli]|uniref:glucuronyl esterase domain-containing protein n=1 Tax=Niabella insulamsoli TaxID=3144874 RepID=UPI0031FBE21D